MLRNQKAVCLLLSLLGVSNAVHAENWVMRDAMVAADYPAVKVFGLVQPTYQSDRSDAVTGLTGDQAGYNGAYARSALLGPNYTSMSSFYLFRVRLGVLGRISPDINYEVVGEYGSNALTTVKGQGTNVELAEGSVTVSKIPGVRLRFGMFKVPGAEEPLGRSIDYVNFTMGTQLLLNTQPLKASTAQTVDQGGGIAVVPRSGVRAFRDTGVMAFDAFTHGPMEYTYALMVGNGSTLNETDDNKGKSTYARVQASYLFDTPSIGLPKSRADVSGFAWYQQDKPGFETRTYEQTRMGAGVTYLRDHWRFGAEVMKSKGMLALQPLFSDGPARLFTGKNNSARAWYVDGGYFIDKNFEVDARYERLDQHAASIGVERRYQTLTLGLQYHMNSNARAVLNYEIRDYEMGGVGYRTPDSQANAARVDNATGNRLALQLSLSF